MNITQRQSFIGICALIIASALMYLVTVIFAGEWNRTVLGLVIVPTVASMLAAYLRGWEYARHALVIIFAPIVAFGTFDVETTYRASSLSRLLWRSSCSPLPG